MILGRRGGTDVRGIATIERSEPSLRSRYSKISPEIDQSGMPYFSGQAPGLSTALK
jgi:hypothetical protein